MLTFDVAACVFRLKMNLVQKKRLKHTQIQSRTVRSSLLLFRRASVVVPFSFSFVLYFD